MVRPRTFNEHQVLDHALKLFWEKGFEATSFDDIVKATGLGRGSLQAAFGSKELLFTRVLDHYIAERTRQVLAIKSVGGPKNRLGRLMHSWACMTTSETWPSGCFLSLLGASGDAPPTARKTLIESQNIVHSMIVDIIKEGQEKGDFCAGESSDRLAAFCIVVLQGIAAAARTGWQAEELHNVVKCALERVSLQSTPSSQIK
ncbi:TetR/AcrR family transcriptional regulator (plasmid) [Agrobacterium sp. rho-13.3]|uniref:TetR/AcrR family transcriptional regulator n=1 Tax=Agrobacterium sp. rho-13.3 TaxID=3072980 RepID=UPI002A18053D|nr:TetR/AcrR family transcriptional regulator [Agrobacterium sp. rho-13.3]MDX8312047.1 TetR/AcrR family transcriptional regulator [Agrobacterium sp. rho-13.3]